MTDLNINGVEIKFPFKPYKAQEAYMTSVIECLQNCVHGVLESPTGTGKTLCLLCSSLGWLMTKKAQIQIQIQSLGALDQVGSGNPFLDQFTNSLNKGGGKSLNQAPTNTFGYSMPKIIYASRTHSQLSQAMQELKRTSYKHVNVTILGSRDQLCIHPEVAKEQNSFNKVHMCQAKIKARNCFYYNNVELRKDDPHIKDNILDIEDLVSTGKRLKCCPYFLTRELKQNADIIFMPYNYLLDPKTRKNQGIELQNNVILLDEAHNVEKVCEEAASLQISSTDIAVCIDEITHVMKDMANETNDQDFLSEGSNAVQKDFSAEDLCILKTMFLELEKAIDSIQINDRNEGDTYPGGYIFEILEKADITQGKEQLVVDKLDKIITYLTTVTSAFNKKGNALQKFSDFLRIVFAGSSNSRYREKIKQCYKVYIQVEPTKKTFKNDAWETKKITKSNGKLISYWCFSPGFGMQQLLDQGIRSVILTSGTLSPLGPFISEIGIDISVQLENPHIVSNKHFCVGIISNGCDGYPLSSAYRSRDDPKYIASLGETIKVLSCILPDGMLIFFPSYPIMKKCQDEWQKMGKWSQIESRKPIFVEPQSKDSFNNVMTEYYKKIHDPQHKGAIFMGVCRGKVSEGLDFANANGRAVIITGLPFPPLKDPRVILKQRYLDENKSSGKESLSGQQWYQLEASRAVNQAVGRIIRHIDDYGAILLCDCRFENPSFKQQLSSWIRPNIKKFQDFRMVIKELREFFKFASGFILQPTMHANDVSRYALLSGPPAEFDTSNIRMIKSTSKTNVTSNNEKQNENFDVNAYKLESFGSSEKKIDESPKDFGSLFEIKSKTVVNFNACKLQTTTSTFKLRSPAEEPSAKRKKLKIKPIQFNINAPTLPEPEPSTSSVKSLINDSQLSKTDQSEDSAAIRQEQAKKYIQQVKGSISTEHFNIFKNLLSTYKNNSISFDGLLNDLEKLFLTNNKLKHLFIGFRNFLKKDDIKCFNAYIHAMKD